MQDDDFSPDRDYFIYCYGCNAPRKAEYPNPGRAIRNGMKEYYTCDDCKNNPARYTGTFTCETRCYCRLCHDIFKPTPENYRSFLCDKCRKLSDAKYQWTSTQVTKEELEKLRTESQVIKFMKSHLQKIIDRLDKKSERSSEPEKT